jgi:hypothetical protein
VNITQRRRPARRRRLPQPKETQIQAAILHALRFRRRDLFAWRNNSGALENARGRPVFFGKPGSADIIGVLEGGRFVGLEVKRPGGEPSTLQLEFAAEVRAKGGFYAVVTSVEEALAAVARARAMGPADERGELLALARIFLGQMEFDEAECTCAPGDPCALHRAREALARAEGRAA